jgi:hypothetical protein
MSRDYTALAASAARAVAGWPAALRDEYEERAAIKEYDGGIDRSQAEFEAFSEINRRRGRDERG